MLFKMVTRKKCLPTCRRCVSLHSSLVIKEKIYIDKKDDHVKVPVWVGLYLTPHWTNRDSVVNTDKRPLYVYCIVTLFIGCVSLYIYR